MIWKTSLLLCTTASTLFLLRGIGTQQCTNLYWIDQYKTLSSRCVYGSCIVRILYARLSSRRYNRSQLIDSERLALTVVVNYSLPAVLLYVPSSKMCIRIVEKYAACRCNYYTHQVQPCASHGMSGHRVQDRIVFVGQNCPRHTRRRYHHGGTEMADVLSAYTYKHGPCRLESIRHIAQQCKTTECTGDFLNHDSNDDCA